MKQIFLILIILKNLYFLFGELNDEITFEQFKNAFIMNKFSAPTEEQFKSFSSQLESKGGITSKREAAMFLAQIMHESGGLQFKREIACIETGCPDSYHITPGIGLPDKFYYGRGYIQLTWDFNYEAASLDLFNDDRLLQNPDQVAEIEDVSWATAFWYWKRTVGINPEVKIGKFGVSTNLINGFLECKGKNKHKALARFDLYKNILKAFEVDEEPNESGCYN